MGLLRLIERSEFSDWEDHAQYTPLWQSDRRHWAWLWLLRNSDYRHMAARVAGASKWSGDRKVVHHLLDWDLKSLFRVGYLFIRIVRVMTIQTLAFSGTWISIRLSSALKLNRYPAGIWMPSTSPASEPWPI